MKIIHCRIAALASAHGIGDSVLFSLPDSAVNLPATVLAVSYTEGKVLYTIGLYTGSLEPEFANTYGLTNSIGYDANGKEYIRMPNVDSFFVAQDPNNYGGEPNVKIA